MEKGYLVVLGGCTVDEYYESDKWINLGDKALVKSLGTKIGGATFNVAAVASKLGLPTKIFDIMNYEDTTSSLIFKAFDEFNIDKNYIVNEETAMECKALIFSVNGEKSIFIHEPIKPKIKGENWQIIANNASYIYSLINFVIGFDCGYEMLKEAKLNGAKIVLDADNAYDTQEKIDVICLADIAVFNRTSYENFSTIIGQDASKYLLSKGAEMIICTKDKDGCEIYFDDKHYVLGGYKVNVVDTTGAGDTFSAAFIYKLSKGFEPIKALEFANAAASRAVTIFGPTAGACSENEVLEFFKDNEKNLSW